MCQAWRVVREHRLVGYGGRRLKLNLNVAKSAVDRPWKRAFLGYTMTAHTMPRLRVAASSVGRLKA
ncbi:MAG: hypothetical protein O7E52_13790, partial [Candidatus Poribacteria bacterium]|nr:hypothetical protein [Candidatus Poribacteria bacterium]